MMELSREQYFLVTTILKETFIEYNKYCFNKTDITKNNKKMISTLYDIYDNFNREKYNKIVTIGIKD